MSGLHHTWGQAIQLGLVQSSMEANVVPPQLGQLPWWVIKQKRGQSIMNMVQP